jgi:hypothetical protein
VNGTKLKPILLAAAAAALAALSLAPGVRPMLHTLDAGPFPLPKPFPALPVSWILRLLLVAVAIGAAAGPGAPMGRVLRRAFAGARRQLGDWGIVACGAVVAALLAAGLAHFSLNGTGHTWEERELEFQARIFAAGRLSAVLPASPTIPEVAGARAFLVGPHEVCRHGKWFTIYQPIWPAVLMWGAKFGRIWLINPLIAAATAFALFGYGRRAFGADAALFAVVLFAFSPLAAFTNASLAAEPLWLLIVVLFFLLLDIGRQDGKRWAASAAGVCLALAFGAREFATVALALPLAAYGGWEALRRRALGKNFGYFAMGAGAGLLPLVVYNILTGGSILAFPWWNDFRWFWGIPTAFEPLDHWMLAGRRLWLASSSALGWPLLSLVPALLPLCWSKVNRAGRDLYLAAAGTLLVFVAREPVSAAFGDRTYYGALPAIWLLGAYGLTLWPARAAARWKWPAGATTALVTAAVVCLSLPSILVAAPRYRDFWDFPGRKPPWCTPQLKEALAEYGVWEAIVFVRPAKRCAGPPPHDVLFRDHFCFVRDRGGDNVRFASYFPVRTYLLCDYDEFEKTGKLYVLDLHPRDLTKMAP